MRRDGQLPVLLPESIKTESYCWIETTEETFLFCGCSEPGSYHISYLGLCHARTSLACLSQWLLTRQPNRIARTRPVHIRCTISSSVILEGTISLTVSVFGT